MVNKRHRRKAAARETAQEATSFDMNPHTQVQPLRRQPHQALLPQGPPQDLVWRNSPWQSDDTHVEAFEGRRSLHGALTNGRPGEQRSWSASRQETISSNEISSSRPTSAHAEDNVSSANEHSSLALIHKPGPSNISSTQDQIMPTTIFTAPAHFPGHGHPP